MHMFDLQWLAGAKHKDYDTWRFVDDEINLMCYDFKTKGCPLHYASTHELRLGSLKKQTNSSGGHY